MSRGSQMSKRVSLRSGSTDLEGSSRNSRSSGLATISTPVLQSRVSVGLSSKAPNIV